MANRIAQVPYPTNEPILSYAPGSPEKKEVLEMYDRLYTTTIEIPMRIGNRDVTTDETASMHPPHDHQHQLGVYHKANKKNIEDAIATALEARKAWSQMPWESRAAIFLKSC